MTRILPDGRIRFVSAKRVSQEGIGYLGIRNFITEEEQR